MWLPRLLDPSFFLSLFPDTSAAQLDAGRVVVERRSTPDGQDIGMQPQAAGIAHVLGSDAGTDSSGVDDLVVVILPRLIQRKRQTYGRRGEVPIDHLEDEFASTDGRVLHLDFIVDDKIPVLARVPQLGFELLDVGIQITPTVSADRTGVVKVKPECK